MTPWLWLSRMPLVRPKIPHLYDTLHDAAPLRLASLEDEGGVWRLIPTPEGRAKMPKLILAAAALLVGEPPSERDEAGHSAAHSAMHARTRSRETTRRLRTRDARGGRPDLRALDLTMRH